MILASLMIFPAFAQEESPKSGESPYETVSISADHPGTEPMGGPQEDPFNVGPLADVAQPKKYSPGFVQTMRNAMSRITTPVALAIASSPIGGMIGSAIKHYQAIQYTVNDLSMTPAEIDAVATKGAIIGGVSGAIVLPAAIITAHLGYNMIQSRRN